MTSLIGTGVSAGGALRNLADNNTWSGTITIGSGNATVNSDAGLLTLGTVGGATRTLTVTGPGDTTVGGVIGTTTGTLVKNGAGTLTLGAANTYTGVTTINAGTSCSGSPTRSGRAAPPRSPPAPSSTSTATTRPSARWPAPAPSPARRAGAVTLTVGGNGLGTGTFSGVLSDGSGQLAVTKIGSGTLTLSGTLSTFTGVVTVNAGSISATNDRALGAVPASPTPGRSSSTAPHWPRPPPSPWTPTGVSPSAAARRSR